MKMICRCSDEKYPEELLLWAYDYLDKPTEEMGWGTPTTASNFLSRAVMRLHWEWSATIDVMAADMWFGVGTKGYRKGDDFRVYTECDELEDGIAYILRQYYKHYRKEVPMTQI